ncbi:MAG TPA: hypothetical protein VNT20_03905 [Flavisolibacter sp.]|nr:hypothetical protein [Flavisolibacter sp.]
MKNQLFLALILTISLFSSAQKKVGGFYKGTLFNESTKMTQQYELALAEYRGKVMGYSYVTFVVNDTFYYGIRKIKAKIEGDSLIVEDDKMIANNFPESPAKHVNRTVVIPFHGQDSLISINGRWTTNKTKVYYSVPGSVEASKSSDSSGSALFPHLKELGLMPNESNYVATENKTEEKKVIAESKTKAEDNGIGSETKKKEKQDRSKTKIEENGVVTKTKEKENKTKELASIVETKKESEAKRKETKTIVQSTKEPSVLPYNQRKEHQQQTVTVSSDSLMLSFYDNGVVDGDSISVYLNDQPVITTKLTSIATKKSIYIGGMDEVKLLLVAENLGSIPPNTGLLLIREGDKTYQVNFTADMQTNASIILKRRRNQ